MFTKLNTTLQLSACKQAERLYNLYQVEVVELPFSDESDRTLELTRKAYGQVLEECRQYGIGGVLINGTFRNLYE